MSEPKSAVLFSQVGGSDKEYQVFLRPEGELWMVDIKYGKRGNCNRPGTKTKAAVPYEQALKIYDAVVIGQLKDGYTAAAGGVAYQDVPEKNFTWILPQLLNSVNEADLPNLIASPDWLGQPKHDGERVMVKFAASVVDGINRTGIQRPLPVGMAASIRDSIRNECLIDGELVAGRFFAFDLLELNGKDQRARPYEERLAKLQCLAERFDPAHCEVVKTAGTAEAKTAMLGELREKGHEGMVFKRRDAPHTANRPSTGGAQLKHKFVESATVEVAPGRADKRSVGMVLYDSKRNSVPVGNVTIPPSASIPEPGTFIEVQYLYAYEGGSLFQPVYQRPRTDQGRWDCTLSQLKYKTDNPGPVGQDEAPGARSRARV